MKTISKRVVIAQLKTKTCPSGQTLVIGYKLKKDQYKVKLDFNEIKLRLDKRIGSAKEIEEEFKKKIIQHLAENLAKIGVLRRKQDPRSGSDELEYRVEILTDSEKAEYEAKIDAVVQEVTERLNELERLQEAIKNISWRDRLKVLFTGKLTLKK